jgi:hypothetical protein
MRDCDFSLEPREVDEEFLEKRLRLISLLFFVYSEVSGF